MGHTQILRLYNRDSSLMPNCSRNHKCRKASLCTLLARNCCDNDNSVRPCSSINKEISI